MADGPMARLARIQTGLVNGMAGLACALAAEIFLVIIYDVTVRTIGFPSPVWTSFVAQYSLLFFSMAAAPYLVRIRGHVFVEVLTSTFPDGVRLILGKAVYLVCIAVCLIFAFVALDISIAAYVNNEIDIRSMDVPMWVQTAPLPFGFGLMAVEFGRFLFTSRSMYGDQHGAGEV